jgi:hypothetical protein
MRARRIIQTGAFYPTDVNRLQAAFDAAWWTVASEIPSADQPAARETLATIVVTAGNVGELDAEELMHFSIRTFRGVRAASKKPA